MSKNAKCLDKWNSTHLGTSSECVIIRYVHKPLNPLLLAKSIHLREIGRLEEHEGKFRRPVTAWEQNKNLVAMDTNEKKVLEFSWK